MPFTALSLSHAPDADKDKHRSTITTGLYQISTVVVKNQKEAIEICNEYKAKIDSVLLCPGFTNKDVAEISEVVGNTIGVCVARGDGPSNGIALESMRREGYFE